jgi:hypothetical protein
VTISPHGTKTVNLQELQSTSKSEGGIRIAYNEPLGVLLASGGLEDPSVGYSAGLHFIAKETISKPVSVSVAELGLMAGAADPMMTLPAGTKFTPYSILRNTSGAAALVRPTLWWMEGGGARSFHFAQLTLQPHQTHSFDVPEMLSIAVLRNFNGSVNLVFDVQAHTTGCCWLPGAWTRLTTTSLKSSRAASERAPANRCRIGARATAMKP